MNLDALAERAVEAAVTAGAGDAEAFAQDSVSCEVRVFDGEVESLTEAGSRGLGIRVWIDGRAGYAYGTDLSGAGVTAIATDAVATARAVDSDEHAAAPEPAGEADPLPGIADPELAAWSTARKVDLAKAAERAARATDSRVVGVETTVYVDEHEHAALASSRGVAVAYESTQCYAFLQAIADEGDSPQTGLGFDVGRSPADLDPAEIGAEGARRATSLLGAAKPASSSCPVVLDPTVAASFVGFVGASLCADAIQRGRSPFAGRLGEQVGSDRLSVTDDGRAEGGLASAPVDGEGLARGSVPLIADGVLRAFLHDSYTARRAGEASTANAARGGYRSPPSVSTSNLVVETGLLDLDGLFAEAGDGMYITDVAGLHSGVNPVTGQFSVGATGLAIRDGALAEPASEFTIASDLVSMLSAVSAAGAEARWVPFGGSVLTPPLLVSGMAIGGA